MSKYADKHMIHTDRYKPTEKCCEACIFGGKYHAIWCDKFVDEKAKKASVKIKCR